MGTLFRFLTPSTHVFLTPAASVWEGICGGRELEDKVLCVVCSVQCPPFAYGGGGGVGQVVSHSSPEAPSSIRICHCWLQTPPGTLQGSFHLIFMKTVEADS